MSMLTFYDDAAGERTDLSASCSPPPTVSAASSRTCPRRVLINAAAHDHPVKWLLAPLTAGASVVLCANLDPAAVDRRVETENVTRVLS